MAMFSHDSYKSMLDQLLEAELLYTSFSASEKNIRCAMIRVLGCLIKKNVLRRYSNLVLDENLNVHVTIYDGSDGTEFNIILIYGE
jgi:hypothetical protein